MRTIARSGVIALTALAFAGCGAPTGASPDRGRDAPDLGEPPNILWIITDSAAADGADGADGATPTPAVQQLAAEGVRFTHAFGVAPGRAAGRSALLTGMHPTTIGTHLAAVPAVPPPQVRSVAEPLRAAGYFTAFISSDDDGHRGLADAFQPTPRDVSPAAAPHTPLGSWDQAGTDAHWRHRDPRQAFFAVLDLSHASENDADRQIAQATEELAADGLRDRTVVIAFGEPGQPSDGADPLSDAKMRVPLAVRWPGRIAPGSVRDDLVSTIDFAPTLLALAGVPAPDHLPGRVFLGDDTMEAPAFVPLTHDEGSETPQRMRALRDHRYKYLRTFGTDASGKPTEKLYDTETDPGETTSLGDAAHADRLAQMRSALDRWADATGDLGKLTEKALAERFLAEGAYPTAARPESYPRGGLFHVAPRVTITCATEGSTIEYTTDRGDELRWTLYTSPFRLVDWKLRFRCGRLGYHDSEIVQYDFNVEYNWWDY